MFITFEGIEGCGKSTALGLVAERLGSLFPGREIVRTREPGGCELGLQIRKILLESSGPIEPMAELNLFLADRAQHVTEIIRPAMERGAIILCDRYVDSTMAYQGHARGLDLATLETLNKSATLGLKPDVTLLLDLAPEEGLGRVQSRGKEAQARGDSGGEDRIDREALDFHRAVRRGFLSIAQEEPFRVCLIDAARDRDAVAEACVAAIVERLKRAGEGPCLTGRVPSKMSPNHHETAKNT